MNAVWGLTLTYTNSPPAAPGSSPGYPLSAGPVPRLPQLNLKPHDTHHNTVLLHTAAACQAWSSIHAGTLVVLTPTI